MLSESRKDKVLLISNGEMKEPGITGSFELSKYSNTRNGLI